MSFERRFHAIWRPLPAPLRVSQKPSLETGTQSILRRCVQSGQTLLSELSGIRYVEPFDDRRDNLHDGASRHLRRWDTDRPPDTAARSRDAGLAVDDRYYVFDLRADSVGSRPAVDRALLGASARSTPSRAKLVDADGSATRASFEQDVLRRSPAVPRTRSAAGLLARNLAVVGFQTHRQERHKRLSESNRFSEKPPVLPLESSFEAAFWDAFESFLFERQIPRRLQGEVGRGVRGLEILKRLARDAASAWGLAARFPAAQNPGKVFLILKSVLDCDSVV